MNTGGFLDRALLAVSRWLLGLRRWVLLNLDHWVNGRGRSVFPVYCVLERTYVLDRLLHTARVGAPRRAPARQPVGTQLAASASGAQIDYWTPREYGERVIGMRALFDIVCCASNHLTPGR